MVTKDAVYPWLEQFADAFYRLFLPANVPLVHGARRREEVDVDPGFAAGRNQVDYTGIDAASNSVGLCPRNCTYLRAK